MTATMTPDTAEARAFRAYRRMSVMLPQFTSFARAISGRHDIMVSIDAGTPRTDGRTIWLRPPMSLGDIHQHDRINCGRREVESSTLICPACRQVEDVQSTLYHEIAHIVFNTFDSLREIDKAVLVQRAVTERPGLSGTRLEKLQAAIRDLPDKTSYIGVSNLISPYLPTLINALEDARVNRQMYEALSGTWHMFKSSAWEVLNNGIETIDGSVQRWSERPENAQVVIGCYCLASGWDLTDHLAPGVTVALEDSELRMLLESVSTARNAAAIYRLAFPVLERLRDLGFCKRPEDLDDDPPPPPPPPPMDSEPSDTDDAAPGDSDDPDDADTSDDAGSADTDDDAEQDDDADDTSDDASDGDDADDAESGDAGSDDTDADDDADDDTSDDGAAGGDDADDDADADDDGEAAGSDGPDDDAAEGDDGPGDGATGGDTDDDDADADDIDTSDGADADDAEQDDDADDEADDADDADGNGAVGAAEQDAAAQERMGENPDDADADLRLFSGHNAEHNAPEDDVDDEREVMDRAIAQARDFDEFSPTVRGVNVHSHRHPTERGMRMAWRALMDPDKATFAGLRVRKYTPADFETPESMLAPTLMKLRTVFADNRKAKRTPEMRSGRIVSNRLPSVMTGNTKVFARTVLPGKKDYFVVLALDVSGSTSGSKLNDIKRMGMALGSLLSRCGVKFAIYAHSGADVTGPDRFTAGGHLMTDVFVIKEENDPWDTEAKQALADLNSCSTNLDGHMMEFLRKRCDKSSATNKIVLYVTDGAMPDNNFEDELRVLTREIRTCAKKNYTLVGVGMGTDSPTQHGLPTVHVDSTADIPNLIRELERRLTIGV